MTSPIARSSSLAPRPSSGVVYLVGAGPGDPGLLTLRGRECLAAADLVLYDGLVNPLLLRHTRGECIRTSRRPSDRRLRVEQAEVNAQLIDAARRGKTVVRLKGGDPFLFGRGSEEASALAEAGIPFEVVPGVTAAIAAGEYAGISFTHRQLASAVAFIAGHEDPAKGEHQLDYAALARFPGTLVFYMGLHRLRSIAEALRREGLPAETPAAVISRGSLPSQRTVSGTLLDIADAAERAELHAPSLIVVGSCVSQREQLAWFERRPLFGLRIGITRPDERTLRRERCQGNGVSVAAGDDSATGVAGTIAACLEWGAEPVLMPTIEVRPLADPAALDRTLEHLSSYDWLVFTSANGVHALFDRLWRTGGDARRFGSAKIACIGPATAQALADHQLQADLVPESYRAEDLAEALKPHAAGRRVLWARATRGRDVLPAELRSAGATVDEITVYEHVDADRWPDTVLEMISARSLDWVGLSSPAVARQFARLWLAAERDQLGTRVRLAAISPVTAETAIEAGLPIAVTAETFTWEGIFTAIAKETSAADETRISATVDVSLER